MQTPNRKVYRTEGWWNFVEKEAIFHCVSCGSTHSFELDKIKSALVGDVVKCRNHIREHDWEKILPSSIYLHQDKPCHDCPTETE
jgi:hypothetical protein